MKKALVTLLALVPLAGCVYKTEYVTSDGRKAETHTTASLAMVSRDLWVESEPGSGKYAPVAQMAVAGVLQTMGSAAVQGGMALLSPASLGSSVVNVIATGGNGGDSTALIIK